MLAIEFDQLMFEVTDGSIKNIGPTNKSVSAKLFGVTDATAREFGDKRIKLEFADEDGNEIQIALFPSEATAIRRALEDLEHGPIFE